MRRRGQILSQKSIEIILVALEAQEIKLSELATKTQLSSMTIWRILKGQAVDLASIKKVYEILDITLSVSDYQPKANIEASLKVIKGAMGFLKVLNFVAEKTAEGLVVTVTDHERDRCLLVNDLLTPDRGILQPWQWFSPANYDFRPHWEQSGSLRKLEFLKNNLPKLKENQCITQFDYELLRIAKPGMEEGDLCYYWQDYYYFPDFAGRPVRVSVSRPGDYEIIRVAQA